MIWSLVNPLLLISQTIVRPNRPRVRIRPESNRCRYMCRCEIVESTVVGWLSRVSVPGEESSKLQRAYPANSEAQS